jgi:TolA-binding protein
MVRTRSTDPEKANHPPETGGPSNNEQMATLEARIAQMSRDMEALTDQNTRLLAQISKESNINEGGGDESNGQSNGHQYGDTNPEGRGPSGDNQLGDNSRDDGHGRNPRQWKKKRLREVVASLDEKYNRLQ